MYPNVAIAMIFFFFKQKTADEVRISDWSSDVCSSDLHLDAIILSRHFSEEAIAVAREMRIRGQPVIFDICDNIFEGKKRIDKQARLARLREVLRSEERSVGQECVGTCSSRWSP